MAKSTEERLEEILAAAAELAIELTAGAITRLTVDFQQSDELPYRLHVPDETVPLVGLARKRPSRDLKGTPSGQ